MSEPYRIRLRGPWEVHPQTAAAGRMTVPGTLRDGGWPGYVGSVSFYRRFGKPSNLGTGDRVRLAFVGVTGEAEVFINGERVGTVDGSGAFDVTDHLRERNELEVRLDVADDRSGILGEVTLEIQVSAVP